MSCLVVCLHTKRFGVVAQFAFELVDPDDYARAIETALSLYDIGQIWHELEVQTELMDRAELGISLTPIVRRIQALLNL